MATTAIVASLIQLAPQLLSLGIQTYEQLAKANSGLPTLEQILAGADADWEAIGQLAQQQLNVPPTPPAA